MGLNTLGAAHDFIRRYVQPGACCIDATAGKGRDTALLCRLAGENGQVLAFDIQPDAIRQTRLLLEAEGLTNARLILDSHSNMERYAEPETIDCIVFNFGRLPGGDLTVFTTEKTSIPAIEAGLRLLKPGGVMSLSIYYGGPNGYGERDALLAYLASLDDRKVTVLTASWANRPNDPPIPVFLWKH
ncbi:MAG: class I SAM-dependent methyltransferase [Butyricicoccus sp.]|nr:class I SAM-dependent methyltransferase [Butyricicoccus sp.]